MELKIKRLSPEAKFPIKGTNGAGYYDVFASETMDLAPGTVTKVPTGLTLEVPTGFILDVRSRGGLSNKGITIANSL
jgi:dUTP pyrophosphatase